LSRRSKYRGGKKSNQGKKKDNPGERLRKPLLNLGRLDYFKYDLNQIMGNSDMEEEHIPSFKASVTAKSSQRSIDEAKDYILDIEKKEKITRETSIQLCKLLDRYTKIR